MGFGAARATPKATMLVGAVAKDAAEATKAREAGADVVIVKDAAAVSGVTDVPAGVWGPTGDDADFLVIDPETTPASALLNEERGYVLVLPDAPEELYLRSLSSLQLDAVYLEKVPSPLTVARQIELGRIAGLAGKPIVCSVKADAAKDDLQCLRAAGVALLLIDGAPDGIKQLKETVLSLPAKRQRRDERPGVSLPRSAAPAEHDHEDDDDDD
jgi:hypothetical protein